MPPRWSARLPMRSALAPAGGCLSRRKKICRTELPVRSSQFAVCSLQFQVETGNWDWKLQSVLVQRPRSGLIEGARIVLSRPLGGGVSRERADVGRARADLAEGSRQSAGPRQLLESCREILARHQVRVALPGHLS